MKKRMFEELAGTVRETGAILRGERKPSRRTVIGPSGVRDIRERTSLSQSAFAQSDRCKREDTAKTGNRTAGAPPDQQPRRSIIEGDPALAVRAIHRV